MSSTTDQAVSSSSASFVSPSTSYRLDRVNVSKRWSDCVIHSGATVYCCEVANNVPATIEDQTKQVLSQLEAVLTKVGSSKEHLLTVTIYLTDIQSDKAAFDAIWDEWLVAGTAPVRACVQAQLATKEYKVEIQATAALKPEKQIISK